MKRQDVSRCGHGLDALAVPSERDQTAQAFAGMKRRRVSMVSIDTTGRGDATGTRQRVPLPRLRGTTTHILRVALGTRHMITKQIEA